MKKLLTLLTILFCTILLSAQEWSEPVIINSDLEIKRNGFEATIDKFGTIHCAWTNDPLNNKGVSYVCYAKSEDGGVTWSEPENVSQNTTNDNRGGAIEIDSLGQVYLAYQINSSSEYNSYIVLKIKDENGWSNCDTITAGMPGCYYFDMAMDNNDKLYTIFRYDDLYYRTLENGQWSETNLMYETDAYRTIMNMEVDALNNVHCVGEYFDSTGQGWFSTRVGYYKYNAQMQEWEPEQQVGDTCSWGGRMNIAIDGNNNPHIIYNRSNMDGTNNSFTYYNYKENNIWSESELIDSGDVYANRIVIDESNFPHIFFSKSYKPVVQLDSSVIKYYTKYENQWEGLTLKKDTLNGIAVSDLLIFENRLHLFYSTRNVENDDIINYNFMYKDLPVGINTFIEVTENHFSIIYPNPFTITTHIDFEIDKAGIVDIKVYDIFGKEIIQLMNEYKAQGSYTVMWNGKDKNGKEVQNGLYLCSLQVGKRRVSRILIKQ